MLARRWLIFPLICSLLALGAPTQVAVADDQTSQADILKETGELLQLIKTYSVEQKKEAVRDIENALQRIDRRIERLEKQLNEKWDKMSSEARKEARRSLNALKQQRDELAVWYDDLKKSSAGSWDQLKNGFSQAYEALSSSWEKAMKEFADE